ncbi:MAG: ABC transporter ATP-binding protein [Anaerolineae bacterium]|nr:ABC transporter ATP-binding protein [Anaerolineae bacterium]
MARGGGHLLEVTNLHVRRDGREILRGVNLTLFAGRVHALLGPNGSGKSTLAHALMGSAGYSPHQGDIRLDGEEITHLNLYERAQRGITLAWQEPARIEGLTVERYLSLGIHDPDTRLLRAALEAVRLDPEAYLRRCVDDTLSGGERKRVELASVQAMRPRVAILDESDSGIDALSLKDIARMIRRMARAGTAVLLISHQDELVASADSASLLCHGRIVETGRPGVVRQRYVRYHGFEPLRRGNGQGP